MIDTSKLRGAIAESGLTQGKLAVRLGMTQKTFYCKMKKGVFDSDEMSDMVEILQLRDPVSIFFAKKGT